MSGGIPRLYIHINYDKFISHITPRFQPVEIFSSFLHIAKFLTHFTATFVTCVHTTEKHQTKRLQVFKSQKLKSISAQERDVTTRILRHCIITSYPSKYRLLCECGSVICKYKSSEQIALYRFKVCKSVHHRSIQINQPTRCNNFSNLLLDVYVQLNMFRPSSRPSSRAQQLQ
jgi:hypothetical protein